MSGTTKSRKGSAKQDQVYERISAYIARTIPEDYLQVFSISPLSPHISIRTVHELMGRAGLPRNGIAFPYQEQRLPKDSVPLLSDVLSMMMDYADDKLIESPDTCNSVTQVAPGVYYVCFCIHNTGDKGSMTGSYLVLLPGQDEKPADIRHRLITYLAGAAERHLAFEEEWVKDNAPADNAIILPEKLRNSILGEVEAFIDSQQQYKDLGLPWKRGMVMYGPPGSGKCLGKDTPVMMHDGSVKPVQDVVVGDLLMGDDSTPRAVISLARGREMLYRITPVKGDPYVVNESHILSLTASGSEPYARGEIRDIAVRDYLALGSYRRDRLKGYRVPVDFPEQAVELDPYILGYWLGDGCSTKPMISTIDHEVLSAFSEWGAAHRLVVRMQRGTVCDHYLTTGIRGRGHKGNYLSQQLRKLGVYREKRVPTAYLRNSRQVRLHTLAGILDADGHQEKGGFDIVLKSRQLMDDVVFLARSLGFAAYPKPCTKTWSSPRLGNRYKGSGTYYRAYISGDVSAIPTRISRKQSRPRAQIKDVLVTGITVQPIGVGDYYGFEITGNGRFLLGDFTVTHNTSIIRYLSNKYNLHMIDMTRQITPDGNIELPGKSVCGAPGDQSPVAGRYPHTTTTYDLVRAAYPDRVKPTIYYIEDLDKVLPTATDDSPKVRLSSLLNTIDGIDKIEGALFIATTNHPDAMAEALFSRPGRFDSVYEVPNPAPEQIAQMLEKHKVRVEGQPPTQIVKELTGYSMAFVEEYVKVAKLMHRTTDLDSLQVSVILQKIHEHNAKFKRHFKEAGIGFGVCK